MGHRRLNFCSIGIELPGPYDKKRGSEEFGIFRHTVEALLNIMPSLKVCVRHKDIDESKKDPGDGFSWEWVKGFGLDTPFSENQ